MPARVRAGIAAVVVAVGLVAAIDAGLPPGRTLEVVALGLATVVAFAAASRVRVVDTPAGRTGDGGDEPDPVALARAQLEAATGTAAGTWFVLAPVLREIAVHRCARHGVELTDTPAARALLGPRVHDLVRPDRQRPADRDADGLTPDEVADALARLEAL